MTTFRLVLIEPFETRQKWLKENLTIVYIWKGTQRILTIVY